MEPQDRAPIVPDRAPLVPERGPGIPERGSNIPDRGFNIPDRGPRIPDRNFNITERGSISERGSSIPERGSTIPERGSTIPERMDRSNNNDRISSERSGNDKGEKSVTALVNSYQQRMTKSYHEKVDPRSSGGSWNNNWQGVESSSQFYTASDLGQSYLPSLGKFTIFYLRTIWIMSYSR